MSRRAARFTQADIARAIKAIQQTGANMMVEIGVDGVIRIVPVSAKPDAPEPPVEPGKGISLW
ncbi:hypothetical protein M2323_001441 [Rhodoblastus acidophilus]|uniref:hypothetical protein n=1 Tax=Rhodoblastus acidophilus TaxID=1074 RepID=UPI002224F8BE|nr:hypothetical protein [Rhodoblastus acidophilus]MCW2283669.1 hypothetical protein [Rhodoblastus acidophilus]MCW2332529.1 hypothetical protein [Rhodoblastus acidophilus]